MGSGPTGSTSSTEPLLAAQRGERGAAAPATVHVPRPTWLRLYVLALFFCLTANQCLIWFTFSSDPDHVSAYYGIGTGTIDLLLNYGPISFVLCVPLASYLLSLHGLRRAMQTAALLGLLACTLRSVPSLLPASRRRSFLPLLHAAQILNGIAGPVLIAAPSRLSALWFPPQQRATVTAIANSSFFGFGAMFYLGPAVVNGNPDNVARLCYITAAIVVGPSLLALLACPRDPIPHPSDNEGKSGEAVASVGAFVSGMLQPLARRDRVMALLCAVMALSVGVYDGWVGVLPQLLGRSPPGWGDKEAGVTGMIQTLACVLGMWAVGPVASSRYLFAGRYMACLIWCCVLGTLALGLTAVQLNNRGADIPAGFWGLGAWSSRLSLTATIAATGFFRSAMVPLLYEVSAEVAHPLPEGTSAGLLVLFEHLALLVVLFVAPNIDASALTAVTWCGLAASPLLLAVAATRVVYRRRLAEAADGAAARHLQAGY